MRHTSGHTGQRRSHHALKTASLSKCEKCTQPKLPHRVCEHCGTYKGVAYRDVAAKVTKKADKKKKKTKASHEGHDH